MEPYPKVPVEPKIKHLQTSLIFKYFIWVDYQSLQALSYAFLCHMYVSHVYHWKLLPTLTTSAATVIHKWRIEKNPYEVEIRPHRFGGGNSNTKCSMTFVNIAVAISALAGGGQKRFRTETRIRWCFRHFSRIFGCLSARGYWNGILGHFGSFPAMEKRPKMKKTLYIARFCMVFGCQSIENTAKTSVLDWRYSKKRVNYRMLDWKHYKNTVKSNVLEGFTAFMAKNV